MTGKHIAFVLSALLSEGIASFAAACSFPEPPSFRRELESATSIFVFRLESATLKREEFEGGAFSEWIEGQMRVIQVLKGQADAYKTLLFSNHWCGGVRLDVGHYFLIATHHQGTSISLKADDRSILDVSEYFDADNSRLISDHPWVEPIFDFLAGKPLPAGYPPTMMSQTTSVLPLPPPPPP